MTALAGRVAIVTGAGRGLGRQHALLMAAEGARVVVNDRGVRPDGSGADDLGPATAVVEEIQAAGGEAVADANDVADWDGARRLVEGAIAAFGDLDVVVNNAGILRDRFLVNMTAEEWDDVVRVHLRGHFAPTHWAAAYWRDVTKQGRPAWPERRGRPAWPERGGRPVSASVVNTSSTSGLLGNPGQANYGAAKAGIAAFTAIAAAQLERYGVRVNAIAPMARTRLTEATPGWEDMLRPPDDPDTFDAWDPANVSPVVAWLATADCPATGQVFYVHGGTVKVFNPWSFGEGVERPGRWSVAELAEELPRLLRPPGAC